MADNALTNVLNLLIDTVESRRALEANQLVEDLAKVCSLSSSEIGLTCSLLFRSSNSLLHFIQKVNKLAEFNKAKENCLEIISTVLSKGGDEACRYAADILGTCVAVFQVDRTSSNRERALQVIVKVVELRDDSVESTKVDATPLKKLCNVELAKRSGTTPTVKCNCFHLLGVIAQYYPEAMIDFSDRLFDIYLRELRKEMQSKKSSDLKIIEGCLKGLACLLVNFTKAFEECPDTCREIYKYLTMSIKPRTDLARYAVPIAGMQMMQKHSSQFGELLVENYQDIYNSLCKWFNHSNYGLKHEAHMAINAFLSQIVVTITAGEDNSKAKEIFCYFGRKFQEMLDATDVSSKALSVALHGYGLFASLCKRHMQPGDMQKMFSTILWRCERVYLGQKVPDTNQIHQLPSFLQSLSSIIKEIMQVDSKDTTPAFLTSAFEMSLCRMCVLAIKEYPKLNRKFSVICCRSLRSVMAALSSCPDSQHRFIAKVVYQGLIRSCSSMSTQNAETNIESTSDADYTDIATDSRSYKEYLSLWKGFICSAKSTVFVSTPNYSRSEQKSVQEMVYNEILTSLFAIISKLDLAAVSGPQGEELDDDDKDIDSFDLATRNIDHVDTQVFDDVIDFAVELLPEITVSKNASHITGHIFEERAVTVIKDLISLATRLPTVGGFYRLLATCMDICVKLHYFTKNSLEDDSEMETTSQDISKDVGKERCLDLQKKFALEVLSHLFQWKDELLSCCLLFLLSLPVEIAQDILPDLVSPLQQAFKLGLTHNILAERAINAMELWREKLPLESMNVFVPVLPFFEPFLSLSISDPGKQAVNHSDNVSFLTKKKSGNVPLDLKTERLDLQKVRSRVIRFLGNIGEVASRFLDAAAGSSGNNSGLTIWDADVSVPYAIPFQEMKLDIRLESLLPSVTDFALHSANRQTKVAACEFLHSVTVYMIGWSAQQDNTIRQQNPVSRIYEHLFPAILRLACDVDQVSRQLFKPLVMQMIHWFTTAKEYGSSDTKELLNAILGGLVNESNSALRHLCGFAVKEFLVWSIKQDVSSKSLARINAKSLFKKLFNLARHPSPGKRLGAAIAFNRFYTIFREEEMLVDEFTFELLVTFIDSLAMAHSDDKAIGTQRECVEVLKHIERIVRQKKDIFNKTSATRRIPAGFPYGQQPTLSHVVEWLLKQSGRYQDECRHQCMALCYAFIPLLPASQSAAQWMREKVARSGIGHLIACFEGNIKDPPDKSRKNVLGGVVRWFDMLLASLDCYCWILQQKLLSPVDIFKSGKNSIFQATETFICDYANLPLEEISSKSADIYTPREKNTYTVRKCMVIVRTLQFVAAIVRASPKDFMKLFPESFWERDATFGIVASIMVDPASLGFNFTMDKEVASQLPLLIVEVTSLLSQHLPPNLRRKLVTELSHEIFRNGTFLDQLPPPYGNNLEGKASLSSLDIVEAFSHLYHSKLLSDVLEDQDVKKKALANELWYSVFRSLVMKTDGSSTELVFVDLSKDVKSVGEKLLKLALDLGINDDVFISTLTNCTHICDSNGTPLATSHGQAFIAAFTPQICKKLCSSPSYLEQIIQHSTTSVTMNIVNSVLEHLETDSEAKKKFSADLCHVILTQWKAFAQLVQLRPTEGSTHSAALNLYIKVVTMYFSQCKAPPQPAYNTAFDMFSSILMSQHIPLSSKILALNVLTFFHAPHDKNLTEKLKDLLFQLSSMHFPMNSKEFANSSSQQEDYIFAVKQLLLCLEMTGNTAVLEVLISIACREEDYVLEDEFQSALQKCLQNVDESVQKSVLEAPYRIFSTESSSQHVPFRCRVIHNVFVPLSMQCTKNAANEFFTACVGDIMKNLLDDHYRASPDRWKSQLALKSCYYKLAEAMFTLLPAEEFKSETSPLVNAFAASAVGKGSTKLLKTFMGRIVKDKNEDLTGQTELMEERRQFHCSVYNALIAAIACTQTEIKWYDAFVFSDNPIKKEFLFDNIISRTRTYSFPRESDDPKYISVRHSKEKKSVTDSASEMDFTYSTLSGCSLSEDVDQFDNNVNNAIRSFCEQALPQTQRGDSLKGNATLRMEKDEMNEHECMPAMVSLLMHMREKNIGFSETDNQAKDSQPLAKWMSAFIRKMTSSACLNVKIFCGKLIINCEELFRPFASHLLLPLMKVVLSYFNKSGPESFLAIDQFVVDVVATVVSWREAVKPENKGEEKHLAMILLEFLMKNIKDDNRALLRRNLDLFKASLECWKGLVTEVNTDIVYHQILSENPKSLENYAGLQLLGTLLVHGLPAYKPSAEVSRSQYFQRICDNILSGRKQIGTSAAEVMGMSLESLSKETAHQATVEDIQLMVNRTLEKLASPRQSKFAAFGEFLITLHKAARHFPAVAEPFLTRMLFNFPKLPKPEVQTPCIDILCLCADKIPNLLAELKAKNFLGMLVHRNETLQRSCVRLCIILSKTGKENMEKGRLSTEDLTYHRDCMSFILPPIEKHFRDHPDPICRQEVYNLAMAVYDIQKSLSLADQTDDILALAKIILLRGLNDVEEILRTQIFNFWSEEGSDKQKARLPQEPAGKILHVLGDLYQPGVEEAGFLTSTCNLLLQVSSRSPDFERPIFAHPLSDCTFQDLPILTPLISDTMRSSVIPHSLAVSGSPPAKAQPNMLRATMVENEFSATINEVPVKNTYNWMTGGSVDTFSSLDVTMETTWKQARKKGSSLIAARKANTAKRPIRPGATLEEEGESSSTGTAQRLDLKHIQRRLRKDADGSRIQFAQIAARKRKQKERLIRQKENRNRAVRMYRSYRFGELPDIEIPHRGLITPLAALAQLDLVFTQRLMSSLLNKILDHQLKSGKTEYVDSFANTLSQVISSSQQCSPVFIGCLLNFVYKNASTIKLQPSIVASAAIRSGQNHLGIRVLEEWLLGIKERNKEPVTKRRKLTERPPQVTEEEAVLWIELARLSKDDFDTMQGIFVGTPVARPIFADAILLENKHEFSESSKIYQKALLEDWDPEPSDVERELWEDSLLVCLKKLGKWTDVNKLCHSQMSGTPLDEAWTSAEFQERFFDPALHSKIMLLLQGDDGQYPGLQAFVESVTKETGDRRKIFETKFADQIALLCIYQEDYHLAKHYLLKATDAFANNWSNTDSSMLAKRCSMLNRAQRMSDMSDFVDLVNEHPDGGISSEAITSVVKQWTRRLPHATRDPVEAWDDMLTYRSFFINRLVNKCANKPSRETQEEDALLSSVCLRDFLERKRLFFQLQTINGACHQNHFALARRIINNDVEAVMEYLQSTDRQDGFQEELTQKSLAMAQYCLSFAQHNATVIRSPKAWDRASKALLQAYKILTEDIPDSSNLNMSAAAVQKSLLIGKSCEVALDVLDVTDLSEDVVENLTMFTTNPDEVKDDVAVMKKEIQCQGYHSIQTGVELCARHVTESEAERSRTFMTFVKYCDRMLQEREKTPPDSEAPGPKELVKNIVKYALLAMKHQSGVLAQEASLSFPHLLQLVEAYPDDCKSFFMDEVKKLPSWMFLRWSSQIVALLDKEHADAVHDVLTRLAQDYPQAVIYPIKTSMPEFQHMRNDSGKKNKAFVKRLHDELNNQVPLTEMFISNLSFMTSPAHLFKDWQEETVQLLRSKDKPGWNKKLLTKYQNMYGEIFACGQTLTKTEEDAALYGPEGATQQTILSSVGSYRKNFAKRFQRSIDKEYGGATGGEKLLKLDEKKFRASSTKLLKEMNDYLKNEKPVKIKEYSKWLADFHSANLDVRSLEIPGQYSGTTKPNVEYHPKIVGFAESVMVMSSLQQPKRIQILASDGHNYYYLVKGNEDLRQDQRVQQVFQVMNDILRQDSACWERKLYIETYQVIPVTSRLGLIEWVEDTSPLQNVIEKESIHASCGEALRSQPKLYTAWLNTYTKTADTGHVVKLYGNMTKMANYTDVCHKYQDIVSRVPQGLLRNAYIRMSSTPEAFLALRQRFATSYATLCISHWILGIGDRHTSNCMIAKKTGAVVGIDFGHAFGTATEGLPVPELVPFRLSPQLQYLMAPHPIKQGKMQQCMVHALSAFRLQQDTILTILDIFLKEPSVDWMKNASKMLSAHGSGITDEAYSWGSTGTSESDIIRSGSGDSASVHWYPRRKIGIVKKKLSGWKPSEITRNELQHNYQVPKNYLPHYQAVVAGLEVKNARARHATLDLSVNDQVDCLLDQATDPNILARTYIGWRFWM